MKQRITKILPRAVLASLFLLNMETMYAQSADEDKSDDPVAYGLAIAVESEKRDTGFGDFTAELTMILKNRHGETSERYIRSRTLEVIGDGDKTLSIFDKPRDVKGTAFLSFSHKEGADDQWLYLPALKRVKIINRDLSWEANSLLKTFPLRKSRSILIDMSAMMSLTVSIVLCWNAIPSIRNPVTRYRLSGLIRKSIYLVK